MFFDHLPARAVGAHRGARSLAPENTLAAGLRAVACGAHYWELDVRLSADGVPVVFHDDTLTRTTDAATRTAPGPSPGPPPGGDDADTPRRASRDASPATGHTAPHELPLAVLRSLDAGSWFAAADPHGTIAAGEVPAADLAAYAGERIPSLAEALALTTAHRFPVNIEIKDLAGTPGHETVVEAVLREVAAAHARDLVLLSSFHHPYLARARRLDPALDVAALIDDAVPPAIAEDLAALGACALHPHHTLADASLIRFLADRGVRTNAWTVNDPATADALFAAGAASIITDFPQRFRRP